MGIRISMCLFKFSFTREFISTHVSLRFATMSGMDEDEAPSGLSGGIVPITLSGAAKLLVAPAEFPLNC